MTPLPMKPEYREDCAKCEKREDCEKVSPQLVSSAAATLGRLGGLAGRGDAKRRTREQLSRAGKISAAKRWAKRQAEQAK